jgi:DNA polymerase-3 subunit delta'
MAKKPSKPVDDDAGFFGVPLEQPAAREVEAKAEPKSPAKSEAKPPAKSETKPFPSSVVDIKPEPSREPKPKPGRAPKAPVMQELNPDRPESLPLLYKPPVPLSSILGQERAIETLRKSMNAGRIHHAWIFHGPPGVGKFTAALAFAAILLDPTSEPNFGGDIEPDPESRTQQMLRAGAHPDLNVVVKELALYSRESEIRKRKLTNIPNEVVKEFFVEPATRTTQSAAGARAQKVFIIDEAELLDPTAQNTILKTLEEPPPGTVLILVTSAEHMLLATTRSRCQRVGFVSLDDKSMRSWLKASGAEIGADELAWLLSFARGSPGRLLNAHQGGLHQWYTTLAPMLEATVQGRYTLELGPTMHQLVDQWARAYVERAEEANQNASKEAANRAATEEMFRLVADFVLRAMRTGAEGGAAGGVLPEPAAAAIDAIREAEARGDANVNGLFVLEGLSADLAAIFRS